MLLPQFYSARGAFQKDGAPSGARDAIARVSVTLENWNHWVLGLRVVNVYRPGEQATLADVANLATSRLDELQEIRCVIGTYQVFPFTAQELIVGSKGTLWHPFPVRMAIRGNVNVVVEGRRLVDYPLDIIPELAITLSTTPLRDRRPGDALDVDTLT